MRKFCYVEAGGERGEIFTVATITEEQILEDRWELYCEWHGDKATKEQCVADWVKDYDAWEDR